MPRRHSQSRSLNPRSRIAPRGLATLAVLWAVALVAIVLVALQGTAFRQAAAGREAVARVRAYWAARAGVEATIARMTLDTLTPDVSSATAIRTDLESAASGSLILASYAINHDEDGQDAVGPEDAHAKININTMTPEDLITLDAMDEGTAEAIAEWIKPEESEADSGTGTAATSTASTSSSTTASATAAGAYEALRYPYKPRQAAFRSLREVELVTGVEPSLLRGEDWNLNGILDPEENDADLSPPHDNADGRLDAGWSRYVTAVSEPGGLYSASGVKRLDLRTATAEDVAAKIKCDSSQGQAIIDHAKSGGAMADFVRSDLSALAQSASGSSGTLLNGSNAVQALSRDQLKLLLDETLTGEDEAKPRMGKVNINTVSRQTLERLPQIDPDLADLLIQERDGRSGGFASIADMLEISGMTNEMLADLMALIDVRSNVYVATVRGTDKATGIEVEIVATLDRSTIPVMIRDLIVR